MTKERPGDIELPSRLKRHHRPAVSPACPAASPTEAASEAQTPASSVVEARAPASSVAEACVPASSVAEARAPRRRRLHSAPKPAPKLVPTPALAKGAGVEAQEPAVQPSADCAAESTTEPVSSGSVLSGVGRHILKAGAIALLAATTIVVPLFGLLTAESSVTLPVKRLSGTHGGATWVESFDPNLQKASVDASAGAAPLTRVRSPLLATACLPANAADGTRNIVHREQVFWPLAPGTFEIVSGFSWRISPISGQLLLHEGVDMAGPAGTPISSVASGTVVEVDENSRSGAYVVIEHRTEEGEAYYSAYLHQYRNEILVNVGDTVTAGQRIGAVGNNGWSTGPHLHFEIRNAQQTAIDPIPFMEEIGAVYIGEECS